MRHRKAGRQFGRNTSHRRAMLRALTANLVAHERIETTDAKAKELRRVAERMITRAIRLGPVAYTAHDKLNERDRARRLAAQRQVGRFLRRFAVVGDNGAGKKVDLIEKVFVDLARRFQDRPGGYTRIIKVGRRRGDNAPMSIIELVAEAGKSGAAAKKASASTSADEETKTTGKRAKAEAKASAEQPKRASKAKGAAKAEDEPAKKTRAKAKQPKAEEEPEEDEADEED
jgi:large subunit ribosomal protein L17